MIPVAFQVKQRGDATLAVAGELTFETAHAALISLRERLHAGSASELDLSGVQRSDSAGLACVLAVLAESRVKGRKLVVRNMPDGMRTLASVCEVEPLLTQG